MSTTPLTAAQSGREAKLLDAKETLSPFDGLYSGNFLH